MPTLKPRRRPKIIRVPAPAAAEMIACSAAATVPDEVVSSTPAVSAPAGPEDIPDQVVSAMPPSAKRPRGKSPKQRFDTGTREKAVSQSNSKKRKHKQTAEGAESQKQESQPRSSAKANPRSKETKSAAAESTNNQKQKCTHRVISSKFKSRHELVMKIASAKEATAEQVDEMAKSLNLDQHHKESACNNLPKQKRRSMRGYQHELLMKEAMGQNLSEIDQLYYKDLESKLKAGPMQAPFMLPCPCPCPCQCQCPFQNQRQRPPRQRSKQPRIFGQTERGEGSDCLELNRIINPQ